MKVNVALLVVQLVRTVSENPVLDAPEQDELSTATGLSGAYESE